LLVLVTEGSGMTEMFKQEAPSIGLSIQRYTSSVPDDGSYLFIIGEELLFTYQR
jgi:hypothetical protein